MSSGRARIRQLFGELQTMLTEWGYRERTAKIYIPRAMCEVLITNRSPRLEDLTFEVLQKVMQRRGKKNNTLYLSAVSKVLAHRKIISAPVMRVERPRHPNPNLLKGVPEKWVQAASYWRENARYSARVRQATYYFLLTVGRWLTAKHPTITRPEQWDRNLALECLTMITNMRCGDFRAQWVGRKPRNNGKPLTPNGKMLNYTALRVFFADLQEWGVIPPRFDPYRSFTPPRSVKALVTTTPRVIADDVWAKLLWAGLNVTPEDFASWRNPSGRINTYYPIEMIRAVTLVWLFAGIRGDEIRRLRVGCVRWQPDNESSVCFLDVPVNKTGTAFTKPVDGDDLLLPGATQRLLAAIETTGCAVAFGPQEARYDIAGDPAEVLSAWRHQPGSVERGTTNSVSEGAAVGSEVHAALSASAKRACSSPMASIFGKSVDVWGSAKSARVKRRFSSWCSRQSSGRSAREMSER